MQINIKVVDFDEQPIFVNCSDVASTTTFIGFESELLSEEHQRQVDELIATFKAGALRCDEWRKQNPNETTEDYWKSEVEFEARRKRDVH